MQFEQGAEQNSIPIAVRVSRFDPETWDGHRSVALRLSVAEKLILVVQLDHQSSDRAVIERRHEERRQEAIVGQLWGMRGKFRG